MTVKRIPRVGIGGPVGSGKTMLIEQFVPLLSQKGYKTAIVSNDVVSKIDADRMRKNLASEKEKHVAQPDVSLQRWFFFQKIYIKNCLF